jgi:hypothetical protein
VIFCQSKVRLPPEPCHRLTCTSTIRAIVSPLEFHFFFFGGGGGGAFGGTYPSVVRLRFGPGPGPGFDGSFGTRGLTCYVVAVVVALWVARIPLFEDSLTVPVVAAEVGCGAVCTPFSRCPADMNSATCLASFPSRFC